MHSTGAALVEQQRQGNGAVARLTLGELHACQVLEHQRLDGGARLERVRGPRPRYEGVCQELKVSHAPVPARDVDAQNEGACRGGGGAAC